MGGAPRSAGEAGAESPSTLGRAWSAGRKSEHAMARLTFFVDS